jgi:hypothetical protein
MGAAPVFIAGIVVIATFFFISDRVMKGLGRNIDRSHDGKKPITKEASQSTQSIAPASVASPTRNDLANPMAPPVVNTEQEMMEVSSTTKIYV